jgi:hypothetical protein
VAHFLEFVDHGVDTTGTHEENAVGQAAGNFLRELLSGEQLLGKDGVLGLDEAHAAMKFHRYTGACRRFGLFVGHVDWR